MLFGRKPEKVEPIGIDSLKGFINAAFDAKLESFARNAEASSVRIRQGEDAFISACERFKALDAEPDFEGMLPANAAYIKSRKEAYADALKQHVLSSRRDHQRHTRYHSYLDVLAEAEEAIASINSTNSIFKQVFLAYAQHLGELKKAFTELERRAKQLKSDIESVREHADEYTQITVKVDATLGLLAELEAIGALDTELSDATKPASAEWSAGAQEILEGKMAALEAIKQRVAAEESALKNIMMPIGRIARKYDHGVPHSRHLSEMVAHPEAELASDSDYAEFMNKLNDLLKNISNGSITADSGSKIMDDINNIMAKDLRAYVQAYRTALAEKNDLEKQISELKKEVNRAESERFGREKRAMEMQDLEERKRKVQEEIRVHCSGLEAMVLKFYRKSISIKV